MRKNAFIQLTKIRLRNSKHIIFFYLLIFLFIGSLPAISVIVSNVISPIRLRREDEEDSFHSSKIVTFETHKVSPKTLEGFGAISSYEASVSLFQTELLYHAGDKRTIYFQLRPLSLLNVEDIAGGGYIGTNWDDVIISGFPNIQGAVKMETDSSEEITLNCTGSVNNDNYYVFVSDTMLDFLTFSNSSQPLLLLDQTTGLSQLLSHFRISSDDEYIKIPASRLISLAQTLSLSYGSFEELCAKLNERDIVAKNEYLNVAEKDLKFGVSSDNTIQVPFRFLKYFANRTLTNAFFKGINEAQRFFDHLLNSDIEAIYRDSKFDYNKHKAEIPGYVIYCIAVIFMVMISFFILVIDHTRIKEIIYLRRKPFLSRSRVWFERSLFILGSLIALGITCGVLLIYRFSYFDLGRISYITSAQFNIAISMVLASLILVFFIERKKGIYHV